MPAESWEESLEGRRARAVRPPAARRHRPRRARDVDRVSVGVLDRRVQVLHRAVCHQGRQARPRPGAARSGATSARRLARRPDPSSAAPGPAASGPPSRRRAADSCPRGRRLARTLAHAGQTLARTLAHAGQTLARTLAHGGRTLPWHPVPRATRAPPHACEPARALLMVPTVEEIAGRKFMIVGHSRGRYRTYYR